MVRGGAITISSDVRGGATIETQLRFDVRCASKSIVMSPQWRFHIFCGSCCECHLLRPEGNAVAEPVLMLG